MSTRPCLLWRDSTADVCARGFEVSTPGWVSGPAFTGSRRSISQPRRRGHCTVERKWSVVPAFRRSILIGRDHVWYRAGCGSHSVPAGPESCRFWQSIPSGEFDHPFRQQRRESTTIRSVEFGFFVILSRLMWWLTRWGTKEQELGETKGVSLHVGAMGEREEALRRDETRRQAKKAKKTWFFEKRLVILFFYCFACSRLKKWWS